MDTDALSVEDIWKLRKKAVIAFYFRPLYILRKLKDIRKNMFRQAIGILKSLC
jgi:hypothetical protein